MMQDHSEETAHWERHYSRPGVYADLYWWCSKCGEACGYNWANKFKYCPNCERKMSDDSGFQIESIERVTVIDRQTGDVVFDWDYTDCPTTIDNDDKGED